MIAYYFPPLGMGGVQRMAKLARYLPRFGYDVKVLTVGKINYPAYDDSLLAELPPQVKIYRSGSTDPARLGRLIPFFNSIGKAVKGRAKKSGLVWPDSKIGWEKAAVKLGGKIIVEEKIDIMLSSSPPVTAHLVARELKQKFNIPWVADFRDFWESYPPEMLYDDQDLIDKSNKLLMEIGQFSDAVTSVTEAIGKSVTSGPIVIAGGYDEEDFSGIPMELPDDKFILTYLGTVGDLHPLEPFLAGANKAMAVNNDLGKQLEFRIIGANDKNKIMHQAKKYGLQSQIVVIDYLNHRQALREAATASVLLVSLPENFGGLLPGKVFDCLALPGAVLASTPVGGATDLYLQKHNAGKCFAPDDSDGMSQFIGDLFAAFQRRERWHKEGIEGATRKEVARQFAGIFDDIRRK